MCHIAHSADNVPYIGTAQGGGWHPRPSSTYQRPPLQEVMIQAIALHVVKPVLALQPCIYTMAASTLHPCSTGAPPSC